MLPGRIASLGSRIIRNGSVRNMSKTVRPATVPLVIAPKALASLIEKNKEDSDKLRILDATWFMPNLNPPRDAFEEFKAGPRLPKALFWDVDKIATVGESVRNLPHMMPSPATFAKAASEHGIEPETHVVVYDTHGVFSAPRTAFTFKAFGHSNVSVLNGGLPAWINNGFHTEIGEPSSVSKTSYPEPLLEDGIIRSFEEMVANAKMGPRGQTVFDARPKGRYDGKDPEPRAGLSSGHIPNSLSLPFPTLLKSETDKDGNQYSVLKDQIELWRTLSDAVGGTESLDKLRQASSGGELAATNTCGSGMTAGAIWLALQEIGVQSSIYDESWMGWASRENEGVPIDKSE
ncbi:related to 3-mercaptopyruvate sulfurtransferase [Melanopsichium pennsylvanicum]|uniref:Related to 3-mercaptopyruvate sulfurtransferase n=2 Tax=Melanopsichium pennsylvanicum TaxID=63383 RepID=A0AAJ5C2B6_9BASI|nr:related to 3-mercaptopyruvate sulfurtransferase [Melanopsichium pennsylvanicum 4]SNX81361.1 related to 3-mercaptopyruvate sulfurtransferase [Melanopsichium pennsylvanicum]